MNCLGVELHKDSETGKKHPKHPDVMWNSPLGVESRFLPCSRHSSEKSISSFPKRKAFLFNLPDSVDFFPSHDLQSSSACSHLQENICQSKVKKPIPPLTILHSGPNCINPFSPSERTEGKGATEGTKVVITPQVNILGIQFNVYSCCKGHQRVMDKPL